MAVIAMILFGLFLIGCVGTLIFWLLAMYHFIAMIRNKRPEAQGKLWSASFMTVYIPSALTDVGRMHRKRGFLFLGGFFVSVAVLAAVGLAMQFMKANYPP
jgi:hypothetical protein